MVLVDTSVWVSHLGMGNAVLARLLEDEEVVSHPYVIGELACGNLRNRAEILGLLQSLPMIPGVTHEEAMRFIDMHQPMGKGLGYVDIHLLASAVLSGMPLWTLDKRLKAASLQLRIAYT